MTSYFGYPNYNPKISTVLPLSSDPLPTLTTMPPKAPLLPTTRMATRVSNKTARPGLVDLSPSKRQSRSAKENEGCTSQENLALQAKQAEQKARALQRAAFVVDQNHREDEAFDRRLHNPPAKGG